jgi:hypothetical protein
VLEPLEAPVMSSSASNFERECFFIAPIGEEGSQVRRRSDLVHKHIVSPAAKEIGLKAVRADELAAPGRITNQIIDHLLHARSAVADLTGRNPNVFYELGVRHMADLSVALIVAHDEPALPFDLAQMRVIRYDHTNLDSAELCRKTLVDHLRAGLEGAVDSPISDFGERPPSGHRFEQWFSEMIDDLRESVVARLAEDPRMTEVTGEADRSADGESQRRVEAALDDAVDEAVEDLRERALVEVDPSPLLGRPCPPRLLPCDGRQVVSEFLESIWQGFAKETGIPRFKYGYLWVLRDRETGQVLYDMGRIWAKQFRHDFDHRRMSEAGIRPGMRLEAIRPERRLFKQHP